MLEPDEIERAVRAALTADHRTSEFADQLEVCRRSDGLELLGTVDDVGQRCRAELVARQFAGPASVINRIELVPYPPRQDGQITDHVRDALTEDRALQKDHIRVAVRDGLVVLEGHTDSHITKRLATVTCWWIPGVRGVDNRLEVDHPEEDRDWIILEAIHVVFSKDWLLSGSNIMFSSKDGVVRLTGSVPGPEIKRAAENDVWVIDGVQEVINDLEIVPAYLPRAA